MRTPETDAAAVKEFLAWAERSERVCLSRFIGAGVAEAVVGAPFVAQWLALREPAERTDAERDECSKDRAIEWLRRNQEACSRSPEAEYAAIHAPLKWTGPTAADHAAALASGAITADGKTVQELTTNLELLLANRRNG